MAARAFKLKVGDLVWAKMKSFHPWPGKIVEPDPDMKVPTDKKPKRCIFFFATENQAWIAEDLIWPYVQFKSKYMITERVASSFTEAVEEIEEELKLLPAAEAQMDVSNEDLVMTSTANEPQDANTPTPASATEAETSTQDVSSKKGKRASRVVVEKPQKKLKTTSKKKVLGEKKKSKTTKLSVEATPSTALFLPNIISSQPLSPTDDYVISSTVPLKIGFLGLGSMGSRIAKALLTSGHEITVWNRTPSKCRDFTNLGAFKGMSPADVVQSCDIVFCCVADSNAVKEVVNGECGVLASMKPGKSFVDMSSVEMETAVELYESITVRGGRFLEAPLIGTLLPEQDNDRQLPMVLTGGDYSLYEDCIPYFDTFTKKHFYLGEIGSATSMTLVVNMLFGSMLAGLAETLALGEKVGLQQEQILEIVSLLPISSKLLNTKGDAMVHGKFNPPQLSLEYMQRGLRSAIAVAEPVEQPVLVTTATNELFKKAKGRGYGDHDTSAIFRATD